MKFRVRYNAGSFFKSCENHWVRKDSVHVVIYVQLCISGVELVGQQKREMGGIILNYFYAVGEAAVGLVAWLTKSWVATQLIVSAPSALFILYYW
jgi:hypothetical protein